MNENALEAVKSGAEAVATVATQTATEFNWLDFTIIGVFFAVVIGIGVIASMSAGKDSKEFFLGGRGMPWWLLGVSMVACTFSCDTPNLVTDIVRQQGVAGNWAWWAFLLTGMLTVFVYAKLWRRSEVVTDLEFYELRYSGKSAAALRGFRSLYLGVFFNCVIMGTVSLAAIKIGGVMFGLTPVESLLYSAIAVVVYATLGGIKGSIWADLVQYTLAMVGAIWAAVVAVQHENVGGMSNLFSKLEELSPGVLDIIPSAEGEKFWSVFVPVLIIPIAVQWWNVWYPGAEPGGGGYIAQRMLSAKNEKHAIGATLFFNFMHYAIRPWPWIIVALASMLVFPELAMVDAQFDNLDPQFLKHDICYPAMMTLLPNGVYGLVVAGLLAAYMSTIATHLNWGSSYVVNDFYKRFVKPDASEKNLVLVGRISTVALMCLAAFFALNMSSAGDSFNLMLQVGAGTGLIYIIRWFWWRINTWTEISAMIVSFIVAIGFFLVNKSSHWLDAAGQLINKPETVTAEAFEAAGNVYQGYFELGHWMYQSHWQLCVGIVITTICWLVVTMLTPPTDDETLKNFVRKTRPGGPGWKRIEEQIVAEGGHETESHLALEILCIFLGSFAIWGSLFTIGYGLQGKLGLSSIFAVIAVIAFILIFKVWGKISGSDEAAE